MAKITAQALGRLRRAVDRAIRNPAGSEADHVRALLDLERRSTAVGEIGLAQRLLALLVSRLDSMQERDLRSTIHERAYAAAQASGCDDAGAIRHGEQALALCQAGSDAALLWHARLCQDCVVHVELDRAEHHLSAIEAHPLRCRDLDIPLLALRCQVDIAAGDPASALARIEAAPDDAVSASDRLRTGIYASIMLGRFEQAEQWCGRYDAVVGPDREPALAMRMMLLVGMRRYAEAEATLRRGLLSCGDGRLQDHFLQSALMLALCQRRHHEARDLLARLDPTGTRQDLAMERVRLHLLEQDWPTAVRAFLPLVPDGGRSALENQLFWAHEVTTTTLARLWSEVSRRPGATPPRLSRRPQVEQQRAIFVGVSPAAVAVRDVIGRLAASPMPVLITGETGTGKEIVARLLHAHGPQSEQPFVTINAAGMPESLAEAELFGHAKGAFTGALGAQDGLLRSAGRGVVFIDEINSMPLRLQGVLLRVLESGEFRPVGATDLLRCRCRFVVASNQPLEAAVAAGTFRQDLMYRIHRLTIDLPPLRDRREDIPVLCEHILGQVSTQETPVLEPELLALLQEHSWPGNVRELRNEIERLALMRQGERRLSRSMAEAVSPMLRRVAAGLSTEPRANRPDHPAPGGDDPRIPGSLRARRRRGRILALLKERPRLYREDVVQAIGCAPATATSDLRALQEAGMVQRVMTSGHLRTSYFESTSSSG